MARHDGSCVGDDGCRVEDLGFKGLERDEAFEIFAYLAPQPMSQGEVIETILSRCRTGGVARSQVTKGLMVHGGVNNLTDLDRPAPRPPIGEPARPDLLSSV